MKFEESEVAQMRQGAFVRMISEAVRENKVQVPEGVDAEKVSGTVADILARDEFAAQIPKYQPDSVVKVAQFALNNGGHINSKELAELSL
jgi:hypothetical protein